MKMLAGFLNCNGAGQHNCSVSQVQVMMFWLVAMDSARGWGHVILIGKVQRRSCPKLIFD